MIRTGIVFDLDGTLIDSVYHHITAWHQALKQFDISLPLAAIHRKIGMSGDLFLRQVLEEADRRQDQNLLKQLGDAHGTIYKELSQSSELLPGARDLLDELRRRQTPWSIATSGEPKEIAKDLKALGIDPDRDVVVTHEDADKGKPAPELLLVAATRMKVEPEHCFVVGDSTWDMMAAVRARAIGIGLLSGGFGAQELERSGAMRIFEGPDRLLRHLDELI